MLVLIAIGIAAIYSVGHPSQPNPTENIEDLANFWKKQLVFAVVSVVGFLALQTTTANAKLMSVEKTRLPEVQAAVNAQQAKGLTGEKLLAMQPTSANAAKFKLSPPQFRKLQDGVRTKKLDISKLNVTPDKVIGTGGGGLAFMTFPTALKLLPWANFFAIIFFVALMLLGIDSAFSMLEAGLGDSMSSSGWARFQSSTKRW